MSDPVLREMGELLVRLQAGTIQDDEVARLDQILAEHPGAMDRFAELAELRGDLHLKLSGRAELPVRRPRRRWTAWIAVAAVLVTAIGMFLALRPPAAVDPSYDGCAVLTDAVDAEWERPIAVGSVMPEGRVRLLTGWAQIEFFSGARVVLEGPSDFELVDTDEGFCREGKLRAFVPPQAQGFVIRAPQVDVIDRGTEFGLRVEEGRAEVHVFQGKVELQKADARRELAGGRAVRIDREGERAIEPDEEAFVSTSQLGRRAVAAAERQYRSWRRHSETVGDDPRLELYYTFEGQETWERGLDGEHEGSIVGAHWSQGRWPGKGALEFRRPGDRVRFNLPGEFDSLTMQAWIRVDALEKRFNTIMLTDGWKPGHPHWQITREGRIRLGLRPVSGKHRDYDSPVIFVPSRFGQWTHVAVVYDHRERIVAHYVDGERVVAHPLSFETKLRIGDAELANWGVPPRAGGASIRNLIGLIDEFAVFSDALSDEEIRRLYEAGQPGP